MKFENPDWRFNSPGPLPDGAYYEFSRLATTIAAQGRVQDILEDFKGRFSPNSTSSRSSTASWAESDMRDLMRAAAANAPVFIEAFVNACEDIKQQGYDVPSITTINRSLTMHNVGYQIQGDTLVLARWIPPQEPEGAPAEDEEIAIAGGVPLYVNDPLTDSMTQPPPAQVVPVNIPTQLPGTPPALKAFLCHSSGDKPAVRKLYKNLKADGYDPWLDVVNLLPGQDWESEIKQAVKTSHVVIVCLSQTAVTKSGFVQKEIKFALDVADEQPEGRIYIIPARLDDCAVPDRLSKWHWVDLFESDGYEKLLASLAKRASEL